jgi:hypothetical protein
MAEAVFLKGDIIRGKKGSPYTITNEEMVKAEVIDVNPNGTIDIKVLKHKWKHWDGEEFYCLEPEYFEHVPMLKVGDIVTGNELSDRLYLFTTSKMTKARVLRVENGRIDLEVLKHEEDSYAEGRKFTNLQESAFTKLNKFSVGDIITGTDESDDEYGITTSEMTKGEVVEVLDEDRIRVKILEHETSPYAIGDTYPVEAKYFKLVEDDKDAKKEEEKPMSKIVEEVLEAYNEVLEAFDDEESDVNDECDDTYEIMMELPDGTKLYMDSETLVKLMKELKGSVL